MNKLLAIIKREYFERVRTKAFLIGTLLGPVMMLILSTAPALLMNMKTGEATRVAVVDETGKLASRVRAALEQPEDEDGSNSDAGSADDKSKQRDANGAKDVAVGGSGGSRMARAARDMQARFRTEEYQLNGRTLDEARRELDARINAGALDAYVVLPKESLENLRIEYHGRNTSDMIMQSQLRRNIGRAISEQRFEEASLDPQRVRDLMRGVQMTSTKVTTSGSVKDSAGGNFFAAYIVGFLIYITIIIYGSIIMSAIIEEKQTRISEVLFSSSPAFPLMMGKLVGIALVALTQFAVWAIGVALIGAYGAAQLAMSGASFGLPSVSALVVVSFFLFFIVGFFLYATLYLLVGSMVTTTQEGQQMAMPIIFLLMIAFFLSFTVIRSPDSAFSFWVSMIPFFAPITMTIRIVTETPPVWQIALSLLIGVLTVFGLIWLTAKIYRTGMLMYGKRASIPEVLRWIKQA